MITLSLLHPLNKTPVQHWTFEKETVIRIGRSTDNDVVLYSAVVSRHHVEMRLAESGWEIINLGTNGTYLEGKRITQVPAQDGIVIRLARSGPNIQIHMGDSAPKPADWSRSRDEAAKVHEGAAAEHAGGKPTQIHPEEEDEDPTSGNAANPQ